MAAKIVWKKSKCPQTAEEALREALLVSNCKAPRCLRFASPRSYSLACVDVSFDVLTAERDRVRATLVEGRLTLPGVPNIVARRSEIESAQNVRSAVKVAGSSFLAFTRIFPVQDLKALVESERLSYDAYIAIVRAAVRADVDRARLYREHGFADACRVAVARARAMRTEVDTALGS